MVNPAALPAEGTLVSCISRPLWRVANVWSQLNDGIFFVVVVGKKEKKNQVIFYRLVFEM